MQYLKQFDMKQFWRLFVDGRFQKKYDGWVGYEAGERGSVQALLNGLSFMIDNFDISDGLKATYLRELHKICMLSVQTSNSKSSPGDIRYLNSGMPFFAKTTTYEHLVEVFEMRSGDGTSIFNSTKWGKPSDELDVDEIYKVIQKDKKINYRNWYPNLDIKQQDAILGKLSLHEFYEAKHNVQMMMVSKMEDIINRYNSSIEKARTNDERLKAICLVSREMELLHPFPDGNARTFSCVTLTHLLTFNGFPPALLENPNLDNEVSLSQWIDEVKIGMKRTKELIKNPHKSFFNYSIDDMKLEDQKQFISMALDLKVKIDNYKEIYLTPKRLVKYTDGKWLNEIPKNLRFSGVGTYGTYSDGNIYFTMSLKDIENERKDSIKALEKVLTKDIKAVVIDDMKYFQYVKHLPVLFVEDCFKAFKECSIEVRQNHNPFTLLLTGTEGKTGAKVQFHHLLNKQIKAHAVLNSANTEVPVLRSLINLEPDDIIEINEVSVGSDEPYRIERTMMVNPNLCFFTNIGPNHMDMHKTIDNIMDAKSSVVVGMVEGGKCIVNSNIEHYDKLLKAIYNRRKNVEILSYGISKDDNARLTNQTFDSNRFGWDVEANIDGIEVNYFIPMIQQHAPLASVGILYGVKVMGYDVKQAAKDYEGLESYQTMGVLRHLKKKSGDVIFYDQSRRGGIHGMKSAFNDLKNFNVKGKIVALVGGISVKKDSQWTKDSHQELAHMINDSKIDKLYTTGNFMNYVVSNLNNKDIFIEHENDIDELAKILYSDIKGGDLLFIIGSAYLYLGRVSDRLLAMKDKTSFDNSVNLLQLTNKNMLAYKALVTMSDIQNGTSKNIALKNNEIDEKEFQNILTKVISFTDFRAELLYNFFNIVDNAILKTIKNAKKVNEDIKLTGNKTYVYNKDYCKQWFNNLDKNPELPKKQLFGSFYNFGDSEFLLHIEVATMNLHIGFVKYHLKDGLHQVLKMDSKDKDTVEKRYGHIFNEKMDFNYRSWGLKMYSNDCGSCIDLTKASTYQLMVNFGKSDLYNNVLLPIIKAFVAK